LQSQRRERERTSTQVGGSASPSRHVLQEVLTSCRRPILAKSMRTSFGQTRSRVLHCLLRVHPHFCRQLHLPLPLSQRERRFTMTLTTHAFSIKTCIKKMIVPKSSMIVPHCSHSHNQTPRRSHHNFHSSFSTHHQSIGSASRHRIKSDPQHPQSQND